MENLAKTGPAHRPLLTDDERIEQAGEESFPASDAPSWTLGLDRPSKPISRSNRNAETAQTASSGDE
jgi:hypothetical protein